MFKTSKQLQCKFVRLYLNLADMGFYVRFPYWKTQTVPVNHAINTVRGSRYFMKLIRKIKLIYYNLIMFFFIARINTVTVLPQFKFFF